MTAYARLTPMPRESGRSVRGRRGIGHGGNARLRTALYMVTARHNPISKPFYDRLRAAARKSLHLAWALVTTYQRFDPMQQQHTASPDLAA